MKAPTREFTLLEGLSLCLAMIGIQLASEIPAMWGLVFYSPPPATGRIVYLGIAMAGLIFLAGSIFDAVTDPLIGLWSDRTRPRPGWLRLIPLSGRRRPFIFWGALLMTFTGIALWFPPVQGRSVANFFCGSLIICLHWLFFTMCAVPLNALGPEIARSKQARLRLGRWIAAGLIVGMAIAYIVPGILINRLGPAKELEHIRTENMGRDPAVANDLTENQSSPRGYQRMAAACALVSLVLFLLPVAAVRERYVPRAGTSPMPAFEQVRGALTNPVFRLYLAAFFLFMIGCLGVQRVLPYWAIVGLGKDEETVAKLMAPFMASCLITAFFVVPILAKHLPLKWLLFLSFAIFATGFPFLYPIGACALTTGQKLMLAIVLFSYCGVGEGIQYVIRVALIGEIIDLDEQKSGERREGIYNGVDGIAFKTAHAVSTGLAALCMYWLGNSAEHPHGIYIVGPAAGLLGLFGLIVVWYYPILHVTEPQPCSSRARDCALR